ncbi:hypothetical protein [Clostridium perfringens]|uniref:hypothetical protein n=1 Tax=Clostridium perfringens TaxID=1502 RepID=UPI00115914C9|nr:hypothetical protein [Clostridium perfringens]HAT4079053.1 hypothetical protein [Clostridium perfringens]HAT4086756.1 hypothetical protein [Clostridium perfringens]HBC2053119.1 hypothetical protein [Clostridium perfringens]
MSKKFFRESQLDNIKMVEYKPLLSLPMEESNILGKIDKDRIYSDIKVPIFPIMDSNGSITMNELRLNEEYTLNKDLTFDNIDVFNDIKIGMVKYQVEVLRALHFNKILSQEVLSITNSHELDSLEAMLIKRKPNTRYHLVANLNQLEQLLNLKDGEGEYLVKQDEKGEFIFDKQIPILISSTITKLSLIPLDEIVVKMVGDTKEIQQTVELARKGQRQFSLVYNFGLSFVDESKVLSCSNI